MSRVITKKAYSEYFNLVTSGQKTFDLRAADFDVDADDLLQLVEIDSDKKPTGRTVRKKVGMVLRTKQVEGWYDPEVVAELGYVVMSLKDERPEKNRQIVDENDNVLGARLDHTVDFSKHIYRVAVLWLLNAKDEILISRRSPKKRNHGGLWGPSVAGTVEGTETYLENIIKETNEEIGLTDIDFTAGPKMYFNSPRKYFTQYFFATHNQSVDEFELEDEVDSVKWVAKDWLIKDVAENPENYLPHMGNVLREVL